MFLWRKQDPVGAKAYLDIQNGVKRDHLKGRVKFVTTANINWSKEKKGEVEANGSLQYFTLKGKGSVKASYTGVKSANLKLAKFVINEGPLRKMLNQDAKGARNYLARSDRKNKLELCCNFLREFRSSIYLIFF